jgi:Ni,Fe-hydrogenase III small subunit/formate hydrogenlyase subunit 6/NADH:ubiquinone oxidoreductase subunit I
MLKVLLARFQQGHRTAGYPNTPPVLPDRIRGGPELDPTRCPDACQKCIEACPTDAIRSENGALSLDMGRCLFCTDCVDACPAGALVFTDEYRLGARAREDLVVRDRATPREQALSQELRRLFGRSLKLRQVSAGGCNGCEADVNVLGTIAFDLGRFGIQMVASPRHADGILVTGCVSENMKLALKKTYDAVPPPKIVIAVGACAISGGPYLGHAEQSDGAASVVPVDLYIPGCPPHPFTILDGLLGMLGRLDAAGRAPAARIAEEEAAESKRWGKERARESIASLGADLGRRD